MNRFSARLSFIFARISPPRRLVFLPLLAALFAGLLTACSSPPGPTRIDNLPMYGQPTVPRPSVLRQADAAFIETASSEFGGNRQLASIAWADQAERFLDQGNFDFAMRRYNQAWLLDPNNYEVFWGFARVTAQQGKIPEALQHVEKALQLCTDPTQTPILVGERERLSALQSRPDSPPPR